MSSFVHLATECGDEQEESLFGSVLAEELLRATKLEATIRILIVVRAVVAGGAASQRTFFMSTSQCRIPGVGIDGVEQTEGTLVSCFISVDETCHC